MKYLSVLSLGFVSAITVAAPAVAQENSLAKPPQGRSIDFLTPEPLSIKQPDSASTDKTLTQTSKLDDVAKSIQPRVGNSLLRGVGLSEDLIRTPTQRSADENPLGFFQVSPPTPSLGINLRAN